MDRAKEAVSVLTDAQDKFLDTPSGRAELETAQEAVAALSKYYGSRLWRKDLADDEAGRLPADLKRGVLSEDGIWNVLEEWRELQNRFCVSRR